MILNKMFEKRRKAKRRQAMIKTAKNIGITAAVGTSVGAIGGVLLAPKSGKETRADIKNKAKEANDLVVTKSTKLKNSLNDGIKEKRNNIVDAKSRIKAYLEEKKAEKTNIKEISETPKELTEVIDMDEQLEA